MSRDGTLIEWIWDGTAMQPRPRFRHLAERAFTEGEIYRMEAFEARSEASHRHQFAWVREAWRNLPEQHQFEPWATSPDALRKHALCMTGWCNTEAMVFESRAEAERRLPFISRTARAAYGYALTALAPGKPVVVVKVPRSQSRKEMGEKDFQRSKTDILEFISGLIEVEPDELRRAVSA